MKNEELKILIVEDSLIFAEGLEMMLLGKKEITEVNFALNYEQCFEELKWKKHNLIILDINFDKDYDGVDIAKKIKELYTEIKILVLTQRVKLEHYNPLMNEIGVDGYLDKKMGKEEIFLAIDTIKKGNIYLDERIESMMQIKEWMQVSDSEKEIIELLGDGLSQKKIAEKIHRTEKTVQYHIKKLFEKTKSKNTVELVKKYNNYKSANRELTKW